MFRNMVTSLFKHDRIRTTNAKAKELRRWADHLITLAKRGDLHARRQALAIMREKDVVHKLFESVVERFGKVSGGYTRIVKLGVRPGDAAPVSLVELVTTAEQPKKKKKPTKAKGKKKEAAAPGKKDAEKKSVKAPKAETAAEDAKTAEEKPEPASTAAEDKTPVKKKTRAKTKSKAKAEEQPVETEPAADEKKNDQGRRSGNGEKSHA
jgi:large subunit ribosomal protein L17